MRPALAAPLLVCVAVVLSAASVEAGFRPTKPSGLAAEVDPFLGTAAGRDVSPGTAQPFGMLQVVPVTGPERGTVEIGYRWEDSFLYGFSHGLGPAGGIPGPALLLMPGAGEALLHDGADGEPGYRSALRHDQEWAAPGFYAVRLPALAIVAEVTATPRTALHRYSFARGRPGNLVVDLGPGAGVLQVVGDREVRGTCTSGAGAQRRALHFVLRFSHPVVAQGVSVGGEPAEPMVEAQGDAIRAWYRFGSREPLMVQVGISPVDPDGAAGNLAAEQPEPSFDVVRRRAARVWEEELGRIRIEGGARPRRRLFYSALYRALLEPRLAGDVDGDYRGPKGRVHRAEDGARYLLTGSWGAALPLHALLSPQRMLDFARSVLTPEEARSTVATVGTQDLAAAILAGAVLRGVAIDPAAALAALTARTATERRGRAAHRRSGFVPADEDAESVAHTLAYSYQDWCASAIADRAGKSAARDLLVRRAQGYKHLFDPEAGCLRPRYQGHWSTPFDQTVADAAYSGSTAQRASLLVAHDVDGLIRLHGGAKVFARKLDAMFAEDAGTAFLADPLVRDAGVPLAYLYAFTGQSWKTQRLVRGWLEEAAAARNRPVSAVQVLDALGLRPIHPAADQWLLGAPWFTRATVQLEGGRRLVIASEGEPAAASSRKPRSGEDPPISYVQGVRRQAQPHDRAYLTWEELQSGGELMVTLGPRPSVWGSGPHARPSSRIEGSEVLPAPYVARGEPVFARQTDVSLGCADPEARIHYTVDGKVPSESSPSHTAFPIARTCVIKAIAVRGALQSPVVELRFVRRAPETPRAARK
jgi:predicted alpha-1,2-mannosidase